MIKWWFKTFSTSCILICYYIGCGERALINRQLFISQAFLVLEIIEWLFVLFHSWKLTSMPGSYFSLPLMSTEINYLTKSFCLKFKNTQYRLSFLQSISNTKMKFYALFIYEFRSKIKQTDYCLTLVIRLSLLSKGVPLVRIGANLKGFGPHHRRWTATCNNKTTTNWCFIWEHRGNISSVNQLTFMFRTKLKLY